MHIVNDENGNPCPHAHHEHEHTHTYTHSHEHSHMDGQESDHTHTHDGEHCHDGEHAHCHDGGHTHCHANCDAANATPAQKNAALLKYMLDHNTHHAAELDQMADKLAGEGNEKAAEQIKKAVDEFQKGNMYLSLALSLVNEQ